MHSNPNRPVGVKSQPSLVAGSSRGLGVEKRCWQLAVLLEFKFSPHMVHILTSLWLFSKILVPGHVLRFSWVPGELGVLGPACPGGLSWALSSIFTTDLETLSNTLLLFIWIISKQIKTPVLGVYTALDIKKNQKTFTSSQGDHSRTKIMMIFPWHLCLNARMFSQPLGSHSSVQQLCSIRTAEC